MRITWLSNAPFASTGYANQTKLFVPKLQELGHELAVLSFWGLEGGMIDWRGIPIYPRGHHPYGQDTAAAHTLSFGADVMISLMDAWVCEPELFKTINWVPWFPVDMEPLPPPVERKVSRAYDRIVYSRFAAEMMEQAGLDFHYVPHGIDTSIFFPRGRDDVRRELGLPTDAYVIGMVAANKGQPSRKAFIQQLQAFKIFKQTAPDAVMYLHTTTGIHGEYGGVNLLEFANHIGLRPGIDIHFPRPYDLLLGLDDTSMSHVFNAFDCLSAVSMGEGFGIPILEAQACGIPVVTGAWTSMKELCYWGHLVSIEDATPHWTPLGAWQWDPHPEAIAQGYLEVYSWTNRDGSVRARPYNWAVDNYDVDVVTQLYWKPTLEAIAAQIEADRQSPGGQTWSPAPSLVSS